MSKGFRNFVKKTGQTALVVGMVAGAGLTAHAAEKQAVTTANLNMRTGQGASHAIVTTIPKGETVNVLEENGSWWKVDYKGQQGYSAKRYLVIRNNKPIKEDLRVKADVLNVRTGPSTNFKRIGQVKYGQILKATGKTDGWYEINFNGQVGYVSGDYVTVNGQSEDHTSTPAKGQMKCIASSLRIRSGAGTNFRTVGYLQKGEVVSVLEKVNNGWFKIKDNNGVVGYCSGTYLEAVGGGSQGQESAKGYVKVTATGLNVRSGAGTGYRIVGYASKGQTLEKLAVAGNGWVKVRLSNGTVGWVSGKYVTATGNPNGGAVNKPEQKPEVKPENKPEVKPENKPETKPEVKPENKPEVKPENKPEVKPEQKPDVKPETKPEDKPQVPEVKPEHINHAPVVTIHNPVIELTVGDKWDNNLIKFDAYDKEDQEAKALAFEIKHNVDTSKAGEYTATVYATDMEGATGSASAKVIVKEKEVVKPEEKPEQKPEQKPEEKPEQKPDVKPDVKPEQKPEEKPEQKPEEKPEQKPEEVNEAPVITAKEDLVLTVGDKFDNSMLNAKATDKEDGKVEVVVKGEVNTAQAGNYELTLVAKDSKGATTTKKVTVVVKEKALEMNEAPTLEIAHERLELTVGDHFDNSMLGIVANDKEDGKLDAKVEGTVNTKEPGEYNLTIIAQDSKGAKVVKHAVVVVKEAKNEDPTITAQNITINQGDKFDYSMLNAKAHDKEDGDLTKDIQYKGVVNTNVPKTYTVTCSVQDSKGRPASVVVTVTVREVKNEAPKLNVAQTRFEITQGDAWSNDKIGATATDKEDGNNVKITYSGDVKVNEPGEYTVTVTATDSKGATDTVKVTVVVVKKEVPNQAPVVTADDISIKQGVKFNYSMLNAKATDADGDEVKITYSGTVNTSKPGKYPITVTATDSKGATASVEVIVTVNEIVANSYDPNSSAFKSAVTSQMVTLVNQHRAANGKVALSSNGRLNTSANAWSKYMADNGFFDHTDGSGNGVEQVFPQYAPVSGENIALTQLRTTGDMQQDAVNLANELFAMWKKSAGHNATMLRSYYRIFGFGLHAVDLGNGAYSIYATQHFGTGSTEPNAPVDEEKKVEEQQEEKVEAPKEEVHEEVKQEVNHETQATPEQKPEEIVKPAEPQAKPEVEAPVAPTPEPEKAPEQPKEEVPAQPEAGMSGAEMTDGPTAEMN